MTRPVSEVSEVSDFRSPSHARTRFAIEKKIELGTVEGNGGSLTSLTSPTPIEPTPIDYCIEPQCYQPQVVGGRCVQCSARRAALASRNRPRAWYGRRPRRW